MAEPELEAPHILELEGFETWRCHPPESTTDSTEPELVIEGPSRHHPSALLDALVQRRPRDRRGLSRPPPDADDQRLRWIRPHFRGPAPAALVERDYRLRQRGEAE